MTFVVVRAGGGSPIVSCRKKSEERSLWRRLVGPRWTVSVDQMSGLLGVTTTCTTTEAREKRSGPRKR